VFLCGKDVAEWRVVSYYGVMVVVGVIAKLSLTGAGVLG
jgi:hypothetical protein